MSTMGAKKTFFFLYGTQKGGTTWLSQCLKQSPHFWNGGMKEWRLFSHLYGDKGSKPISANQDASIGSIDMSHKEKLRISMKADPERFISNQISHVRQSKEIKVLADMTPCQGYKLPESGLRSMAQIFKKAEFQVKGILLMRDPFERIISQLSTQAANGKLNGKRGFDVDRGELSRLPDGLFYAAVERSDYPAIIKKMERVSDMVTPLVMSTDDLHGADGLRRVCQFLDITPVNVLNPRNVGSKNPVRLTGDALNRICYELAPIYDTMETYFGDSGLPISWQKSALFIKRQAC